MSTWDRAPYVDLTGPPLNLRPRCTLARLVGSLLVRAGRLVLALIPYAGRKWR